MAEDCLLELNNRHPSMQVLSTKFLQLSARVYKTLLPTSNLRLLVLTLESQNLVEASLAKATAFLVASVAMAPAARASRLTVQEFGNGDALQCQLDSV